MILPLFAVLLLAGAAFLLHRPDNGGDMLTSSRLPPVGYGPTSYSAAVEEADRRVDLGRDKLAVRQDKWLRFESLARALSVRGALTGSYADLAEASKLLERAQSLAPAGSGPMLTRAENAVRVHRLEPVAGAVSAFEKQAVPPDDTARAEARALLGDVAFFRGHMIEARRHYGEAQAIAGGSGVEIRMFRLAMARGDHAGARHIMSDLITARPHTPQQMGLLLLQRGAVELAAGQRAEARKWFEAADRIFPGHWLIQAHVAQGRALDGDREGAIRAYESIAGKFEIPEIMDALAMLYRAGGQMAASHKWADRASVLWSERLRQLPEAAYGHAVEHELIFGDSSEALRLAKANVAARPHGEARILLASAYLANGLPEDALTELDLAHASGWRSASLFVLRSEAALMMGRSEEASEARDKALSYNPRIFDSDAPLVWFSHG